MEIKIKHNGDLIDASIEMVDGVMVVSPKKEKIDLSQFKNGDILVCGWGSESIFHEWICILDGRVELIGDKYFMKDVCGMYFKGQCNDEEVWIDSYSDSATLVRHATDEEKKLLFDKLKEKGFEWDAEMKVLVEIKWKPSVGEICFVPYLDFPEFITKQWLWEVNWYSTEYYNKGWCFQTKEECEQFCQKLNQAIEGVKP